MASPPFCLALSSPLPPRPRPHCLAHVSHRFHIPSALPAPEACPVSEPSDIDHLLLSSGPSPADAPLPNSNLPPRICTLRKFGKSAQGIVANEADGETVSAFFNSLAASIEFSTDMHDWEILSGRLAMMVFVSAVMLEALTGNGVFEKMDPQRLVEFCAAVVISISGAAGFALAWQAKSRVAHTMSKGYENLLNALIDSAVDSLLFDKET